MSSSNRSNLIDIEVLIGDESPTGLAIKVRLDEESPWVWLPLSAVEIERVGFSSAVITISEEFATEKGLV